MERIGKRKELRTRFMNELFEVSHGMDGEIASTVVVAQRLGVEITGDEENDRDIIATVRYLDGEGLLQADPNGGGYLIKLTHFGVREVEEARDRPDEPTSYFAPINVVYAQTISNSNLQQGSPGATQSLTILGQDHRERLRSTLQSIKGSIDEFNLEQADRAELEAEVRTLEAQADSPKPKREVVHPSLVSARNILEGAASGVAAQGVIEAIGLLLSSM